MVALERQARARTYRNALLSMNSSVTRACNIADYVQIHTGTGILIFGEACILSPLTDCIGIARVGCARSTLVARNRVDCIIVAILACVCVLL